MSEPRRANRQASPDLQMCARPGCSSEAEAWLTYDYATRQVWLDDGAAGDGGNHWALCRLHVARLRVPQGWAQVDRRLPSGAPAGPAFAS